MCRGGKHTHKSRAKAALHLKRNISTGARAYFCPDCDGWHVGKPEPWRKNKVTFKRRETIRIEEEALV